MKWLNILTIIVCGVFLLMSIGYWIYFTFIKHDFFNIFVCIGCFYAFLCVIESHMDALESG